MAVRLVVLLLVAGWAMSAHGSRTGAIVDTAAAEGASSRVVTGPFQVRLVRMSPGRYLRGDVAGIGQSDEQPVREVLVRGFWMMTTEVTRGMYAHFVEATGHDGGDRCWVFEEGWVERAGLDWRDPGFAQTDEHPVTCVNWHDANAFATWLSSEAGVAFRLPTEAEWEYAARAGSDTTYHWGNDRALLCTHANAADRRALEHYPEFDVNDCDDGYVRTSPVGIFDASPWGLFDIYGNVWEWVEDCWATSYDGAPLDGSARTDGDCTRRGFRGGGYGDIPAFSRSTLRNRDDATHRKDDIGFRLVIGSGGAPADP